MDPQVREAALPCGELPLFCRSALPAGAAWARLAVFHGYGDHSGRHLHFLRWMAGHGVAAHALDFRGHGRAGGRRAAVLRAWEEYLEDVDAFMASEALAGGTAPLFLLGHSHGALVLAAWLQRGAPEGAGPEPVRPRGCIMTAPYFRGRMHVPAYKRLAARLLDPVLPGMPIPNGLRAEWMSSDEALVAESRGDPLLLSVATPRWYIGCGAAQTAALSRAGELETPLLVLMGDADPVADPRAAHDFYARAGSSDKTYRVYPDCLHELLRERERERVFEHVLEWMRARA